jgi:hypothetical protein
MKVWMKVTIAVIGTGIQGGLTYGVSLAPQWAQVFAYLVLAIGGTMTIVINWPTQTEA